MSTDGPFTQQGNQLSRQSYNRKSTEITLQAKVSFGLRKAFPLSQGEHLNLLSLHFASSFVSQVQTFYSAAGVLFDKVYF